jgi:hypothetical protein
MNKIKFIGILVLVLTIILLFLIHKKSDDNKIFVYKIEKIYKQKEYTQSLAKNVLYIYQNKKQCKINLNSIIDEFDFYINNTKNIKLHQFYNKISEFQNYIQVTTMYSDIIVKTLVNEIYFLNLELVSSFNKSIKIYQDNNQKRLDMYRYIQNTIFLILFLSLCYLIYYLFTTSIKFDKLIDKIDKSIKDIDKIDTNIENMLNLNKIPHKKEDKIIESLDELLNSQVKLIQLKKDLQDL